jgi:hypothetical protein
LQHAGLVQVARHGGAHGAETEEAGSHADIISAGMQAKKKGGDREVAARQTSGDGDVSGDDQLV